jgi:hypothetical protein
MRVIIPNETPMKNPCVCEENKRNQKERPEPRLLPDEKWRRFSAPGAGGTCTFPAHTATAALALQLTSLRRTQYSAFGHATVIAASYQTLNTLLSRAALESRRAIRFFCPPRSSCRSRKSPLRRSCTPVLPLSRRFQAQRKNHLLLSGSI